MQQMETYVVHRESAQIFMMKKKSEIRSDFSSAVYPMTFVKSVINDFESKEHNLINDTQLFISRF